MKFTTYDLRFMSRLPCVECRAEATAFRTLTRLPGILEIREAFGMRPVYRRHVPGSTTKQQNEDAL